MKTVQLLTVLTLTLTSLNSQAQVFGQIKGPGMKGPKLTISEDQLINMIKNEQPQQKKQTPTSSFEESEIAQLEELLQKRVQQESGLVHLRDQKTLNNVLSFSALALQAWNPELRTANLKTQIARNIVNFGFMQGLVAPTMALIDLSYATGRPNFGNLLNVMLADITPSVAAGFESKYQIPTVISGHNFASISATGRNGMWQILTTQLGADFFANHSLNFQGSNIKDRINPMNFKTPSMDQFVGNTLRTENSYLNHYVKMIGHDNSGSNIGSNVAAIKQKNQEKFNQRKGIFSNASANEPNTCLVKCLDEMGERAVKYGEQFAKIGGVIGTASGIPGGPPGMATGAATMAATGGLVGLGVGAAAGAYECAHSKQCGGDEGSVKKENEQKEKELEQKEKQVKEQKEAQEKQHEILVKEQEKLKKEKAEIKKQQDDVKKQQDEVKKQQDEIKKQQEQIKKQQEDLKKQNDEKKQQEIKKQQIEMENKQKELKKKEDELKKREAELKKQEDDKKHEEEENEKKKKQNEVEVAPKGKAMMSDDEKSGNTADEIAKMKSSNSTPMVPADDYVSGGSSFSKLDVIKVMQKEKTAQSGNVSVVLPVAPNGGE